MQQPRQEQQLESPQGPPGSKHPTIAPIALIFGIITLICFTIAITIGVLSTFGLLHITWSNYLALALNTLGTIFTIVTVLLSTSQRFFRWAISLVQTEAGPTPSSVEPLYSSISSSPPPTDSKAILQRKEAVKQIYEMLIQPEITAIVLTGIAGIGKSTLAALVYRYIEGQRHQHWPDFPRGKGPFAAETLWLKVDPSMKMTDIARTLFNYLGKPLPINFDNLPPQTQALALTSLLQTTKKSRLIILDQFDVLFNVHAADILLNHAGIGEWIDALNSQKCKCKILFTSCSWLRGVRVYPRTHLQEYHVSGVSIPEGTELLSKHKVTYTEAEVRRVIELCGGHMLALTELVNLLEKYQITLANFLTTDSYFQLWSRNITSDLVKDLYTKQLDRPERKLLSAFAVYRIPVSLDGAKAVLDSATTKIEILEAFDVLLSQHLLIPSGKGHYEPHPIVASYIHHGFEESDEQDNSQPSQDIHNKAAAYCLQRANEVSPPKEQRENIRDIQFLMEAVWQLCQGEQWIAAYKLMLDENIFGDLKSWGENTTLLDLYQLLLPANKWQPQELQEADIYGKLGEIHTEMVTSDGSHADEALKYFKLSFTLYSKFKNYKGTCSILQHVGRLYLKQVQYKAALAFFLQVEKLSNETQNAHESMVQKYQDEIRRLVGDEQFEALLLEVTPQAGQIVEKMMN